MSNLDSFYSTWEPRLLSVLRIMAGFLLMPHGAQKLFGFLAAQQATANALPLRLTIAGVLELFGGFLIFIGLFTRPVAFILSGLMAAAYFLSHAPQGFWPLQNRGELAALYCFVFLYMAVAGGGAWSLDRLFRRQQRSRSLSNASGSVKEAA